MAQTREEVAAQYETLTPLVRPGDWDYATEELEDNTTFADGVVEEKIAFYSLGMSQDTHSVTIYKGSEDADFDYYLVFDHLPGTINFYGFDEEDAEIIESFEDNPLFL